MNNTTTIEIPKAGPNIKRGMYNIPANEGWIAVSRYRTRTAGRREDQLFGLLYSLLHHAELAGYDFAKELKRACDDFAEETKKEGNDLADSLQRLSDGFASETAK
jgi:hypothetical protein